MKKYETILHLFEEIYGEDQLLKFRSALIDELDGFSRADAKDSKDDLSEKDSILITYGDSICTDGEAPLVTLRKFLGEHVGKAISAVHLLPFFPYSSDDGFSVIDYDRVDPALGDWEDIDALAEDYGLMFDAVINHVSVKSGWFQAFLAGKAAYRDYFIIVDNEEMTRHVFRPRALPLLTSFETPEGRKRVWTTFSEDQVDLNFHNPRVLLEIVAVLLSFAKHGARFIRLDAIAYVWKEPGTNCIHQDNAHRIVKLFRAIFDCVAPDVRIITETNVPHEDNISYFGDGKNEAQLVYNFSLPPLVLHAFHQQSAVILTDWAKTLKTPSSDTHFFNFLASHDGIGITPARGLIPENAIKTLCERVEALGGFVSYKDNADGSRSPYELNINYLDALGDPAMADTDDLTTDRFLASQSIMLALKGLPGIYYHSLLGSRSWKAGVKQTGRFRTINREKLNLAHLRRELFAQGTLQHRVFSGYLEMLHARGALSNGAFHPQASQVILEPDRRVMAILRESPDQKVLALCLTNVSREEVMTDFGSFALPSSRQGQWQMILARNSEIDQSKETGMARLGAYGVLWLLAEKPN